jgi:hypothetical protein
MGILGAKSSSSNPHATRNEKATKGDEPISSPWPDSPSSTKDSCVERIVHLPHGRFAVFVSIGPASLLVTVSALNLLEYYRFRRAALAELGIVFRNSQFSARGTGQADWEEMLARHLHCWEVNG